MPIVSPRVMASARRVAAPRMPASVCGSGISARTVGSRKLATSSTSTPRPARMRASSSGTSSWRCAIASARAALRSSSRSRQTRPHAECSTPRKRRRLATIGAVSATVISGTANHSKKPAILDEAGALRQLVVERARERIALVGQRVFGDEQVLQVAVVADRPARAVEKVVRYAAKSSVHEGAEPLHRLRRIVQARPRHVRGLVGDHDPVEDLVALPQRLPVGALIHPQGPDLDIGCNHAAPSYLLAIQPLLRGSATAPV